MKREILAAIGLYHALLFTRPGIYLGNWWYLYAVMVQGIATIAALAMDSRSTYNVLAVVYICGFILQVDGSVVWNVPNSYALNLFFAFFDVVAVSCLLSLAWQERALKVKTIRQQ